MWHWVWVYTCQQPTADLSSSVLSINLDAPSNPSSPGNRVFAPPTSAPSLLGLLPGPRRLIGCELWALEALDEFFFTCPPSPPPSRPSAPSKWRGEGGVINLLRAGAPVQQLLYFQFLQ